MKIGAIYPQTELRGDPKALDAFARSVELLDYDYLVMFDHVAGAVHVSHSHYQARVPRTFLPPRRV